MKKLFLIVALALAVAGCSNGDEARRVLRQQGYTRIETTGYAVWGCDEKDTFHTGFRAVAPNGARVSGVVCSGWLKGATVRFD